MVGWHHRLNGRGFEQTPGDGEGQGSLACFSPWGLKELDMTEGLNEQHEGGVWENLGNNVIALYLKWSYDLQPYSFVKILATVSQRVILLYITCFKWRWNEDFFIRQVKWSVMLVAQSCPTLCNPMDYNPSVSSVHGIFQARILEWVAISFSRGSSWLRYQTRVSYIAGRLFTIWATREAQIQKEIYHQLVINNMFLKYKKNFIKQNLDQHNWVAILKRQICWQMSILFIFFSFP